MAKTVCKILGVVFLLVGIAGFVAPTLLGAHLTPSHNIIHLVSGALALYFGFSAGLGAAKTFATIIGIVYLGLGILGFAFGSPPEKMWVIAPGVLVFGTVDHGIHVLLGVIFLAAGLFTKK